MLLNNPPVENRGAHTLPESYNYSKFITRSFKLDYLIEQLWTVIIFIAAKLFIVILFIRIRISLFRMFYGRRSTGISDLCGRGCRPECLYIKWFSYFGIVAFNRGRAKLTIIRFPMFAKTILQGDKDN